MAFQAMFFSVELNPMYDDHASDLLKKWLAFLLGAAFLFSIIAVLLVTLFYAQLNQPPRDCDIVFFFEEASIKIWNSHHVFSVVCLYMYALDWKHLISHVDLYHLSVAPWTFLCLGSFGSAVVYVWFLLMRDDSISLQQLALGSTRSKCTRFKDSLSIIKQA